MIKHIFSGVIACLCVMTTGHSGEINATLSTRYIIFPAHKVGTEYQSRSAELKLEAFQDFGSSRLVADLVGRTDADDAGRRITEVRQAYLRTPVAGFETFIGNRQVFWGNAESTNVVDVINQNDAAASEGSQAKLGAPSLSIERYMDEGDLQLWFINSFREKTFNDADGHPSSGIPISSARYQRDDGKKSNDFAGRLSTVSGDWDLAGSFFYGTARNPVLQTINNGAQLQPYYLLMRSVGIEAQHTGENLLFKWESLHGKQENADFSAAVTGIEYTFYGIVNELWDLGIIAEFQHDDRPQAAAYQFLVAGLRLILNDVNDSTMLLLISSDREKDQSLVSIEASKRLSSWSSIELSATSYSARSPSSAYGLLADDDSLSLKYNIFF